ncbi:MAG: 3-deoxy-D-manno-octulosonic acid transferase [Desulfovermiculus sp.]
MHTLNTKIQSFSLPASFKAGLGLYSTLWYAALPLALGFQHLRSGLWPRICSRPEPRETDIWIQAASAGECTLVQTLLQSWPQDEPISCLATTNTLQGMQVLTKITPPRDVIFHPAYAPLDTGLRVRKALNALRPRVVVLLETELWPNLLAACTQRGIPVLLINARMTPKSLSWYTRVCKLGRKIRPRRILAVDQDHACRYSYIFGSRDVDTMRNIKFDRWSGIQKPLPFVQNPLSGLFKAQSRLLVYGSIRREEEPYLVPVIARMASLHPRAIQAVFPRHMHRIPAWKKALQEAGLSWKLRSQIQEGVPQGTVILWDSMGELEPAYAMARAVFIGGSLAPKGGQNFLESLAQGVVPCIGPWWSNFSWVGKEIVDQGLLTQISGPEELVQALSHDLRAPHSREKVHHRFAQYLHQRQGGVDDALFAIRRELDSGQY